MLRWALGFFLVALLAVILGFGGVAGVAAEIGQFLLIAAVVVAIIYAVSTGFRRGV